MGDLIRMRHQLERIQGSPAFRIASPNDAALDDLCLVYRQLTILKDCLNRRSDRKPVRAKLAKLRQRRKEAHFVYRISTHSSERELLNLYLSTTRRLIASVCENLLKEGLNLPDLRVSENLFQGSRR